MSRIGKLPVKLQDKVEAKVEGNEIRITGPKGSLERKFPAGLSVEVKNGAIEVSIKKLNKANKAVFGTMRAHIANMVAGVSQGWKKQLELVGTGYRAEVSGKELILTVGYSHPVKISAPEDISFVVEKNIVTVEGVDKELVGQIAAKVRDVRPPEPYKGKGIKYLDEIIRRKAGKAAKTVGAPA